MRIIVLLVVFFLWSSSRVDASFLVVESDGAVQINVLGTQSMELDVPQNESLSVRSDISAIQKDSLVLLTKRDSDIFVSLENEKGTKEYDVSSIEGSIVEIEERPEVTKLLISAHDNIFSIEEAGLVAQTEYEIVIDTKKARVLLDTPSGTRFLSLSPREATQTILRANTVTSFDTKKGVWIVENETHDLTYKVEGEKDIPLFNVYTYKVPVTVYISALTGAVTRVEEPQWYTFTKFLFV